ncbi:DUF3017 domain-containing protein [Nocardioides zeae]|uniref:DUF3017 domain-containing protein n=1 Tax=Nocardioides zeae TaxID=1457234 RepID=A0A6P0HKA4_9ACTN|nr:DUF3017 domain-containing protein [Nocardioides zeae]
MSGRRRLLPAHVGGYVYLAVAAVCAVALWVAVQDDWRSGIRWFSVALVAGGAARLVLPESQAGMLAVRNRFLDAGVLVALGVTLFALATDIPEQPGA